MSYESVEAAVTGAASAIAEAIEGLSDSAGKWNPRHNTPSGLDAAVTAIERLTLALDQLAPEQIPVVTWGSSPGGTDADTDEED